MRIYVKNNRQKIWQKRKKCITLHRNYETRLPNAKIAQLVEHDLAKVGVAGSSPVFRSKPSCIPQTMSGWWNW